MAFSIDNDLRGDTFASWLRRSPWWANKDADLIEDFWADRGFTLQRVVSEWLFASRADLAAVVRIEFPAELADRILAEHEGVSVEYHYALYHRRY